MKNSYKKIRGKSPHASIWASPYRNLMVSTLLFILLIFGTYRISAQSPVAVNGKLHVSGTNLVNEQGVPVQLRGMSSHGLNYFNEDYNFNSLSTLANKWGISVFRLAVYPSDVNSVNFTKTDNAYDGDTAFWRGYINNLVDICGELGIYCIIDWHVLIPGNPNDTTYSTLPMAKKFWDCMSRKHAGKKQVLYEICNEPNGYGVTWDTVKYYANIIIPIIRKNDPNTVIIVGSPTWSSDVNIAARSPITDPVTGGLAPNVMYSFHFYAGTHYDSYRQKADTALNQGLALFMTEWGTMTSDGAGAYDWVNTDTWLNFMQTRNLSWCNWDYSDEEQYGKSVNSSALSPGSGAALLWDNTSMEGDSIKKFIANPPNAWNSSNNWQPAVNISSPLNGDYFLPGTTVFLKADAVDEDGSVSSVDFYVDGVKFKTSTVAPFTVQWTPATAKNYVVTAIAMDNMGATSDPSLPDTIRVVNTMPIQTAYPNGIPAIIPGPIYTFKFDNGGELVAYHDLDRNHKGALYYYPDTNIRMNEGVDIEGPLSLANAYPQYIDVGYVLTGEWMEYTVNVTTTGTYNLAFIEATPKINGGKFHLESNGVPITPVTIAPPTGTDWSNAQYDTVFVQNIALKAGQQVLRLYFDQGNINVRTMYFTFAGGTVHTITPTAGTGGLISPSTPVTVANGASQTFTITPLDGYTIADVKVDGTSVGAVTTYTFSNITSDHTISATFKTSYTIISTAGENGTIDPLGTTTFNSGDNQTYTITPDPGYDIMFVLVDGNTVPIASTYSFNGINANHTIDVGFKCDLLALFNAPYQSAFPTFQGSYSYYYAMQPNNKITYFDYVTSFNINWSLERNVFDQFSINLNYSPYYIDLKPFTTYSLNGTDPGIKITGSSILDGDFYVATDNGNFVLIDKSNNYANYYSNTSNYPRNCNNVLQSILAAAGPNGVISPSGNKMVMKGGTQTFNITPSSGYMVSDVKVDGVSQGANTSYLFYNVTANHTINATFAPKCNYLTLYGVPRSSGLPTVNGSYSHAYVLGTGGPNLSNVNSFVVSWNLSGKSLSQFSLQTNNGVPTWFLSLIPKMTNTFASKSPSCTISGSGITGLDGTYYVNIVGSDFVMVSNSNNFAIYLTNSTKAPAGCSTNKSATVGTDVAAVEGESFAMYPNPIDKNEAFNINFGKISSDGAIITITDLSGKLIFNNILRSTNNSLNLGNKLNSGFYIVRVVNGEKQYIEKLIVK